MNELQKILLVKVLKKIQEESEGAYNFSQGLWEGGDKINAHFQEGRSNGLKQASILIEGVLSQFDKH